MKTYFAFDLESTVTKCELLPLLAREAECEAEMRLRTERAMRGEVDFAADFAGRVALLHEIPLSRACEIAASVPVHPGIARFLQTYRKRCTIVTGNLDLWIKPLIERLGMTGRCRCSEAQIINGNISIASVLDKAEAVRALPRPLIAIGDGGNDVGMLCAAEYAIAFGGVRAPCPALLAAADIAVYSEEELLRELFCRV